MTWLGRVSIEDIVGGKRKSYEDKVKSCGRGTIGNEDSWFWKGNEFSWTITFLEIKIFLKIKIFLDKDQEWHNL